MERASRLRNCCQVCMISVKGIRCHSITKAFQTKMWRSDLRKFRTILAFARENVCAS